MFSQERIQQATKEIVLILEDCCLSDRTRSWYTHHYAELNSYIRGNKISEITFLDFLHAQYGISMSDAERAVTVLNCDSPFA